MEMKDLANYWLTLLMFSLSKASTVTLIIFQTRNQGGMAKEETDDVLNHLAKKHVLVGIVDEVLETSNESRGPRGPN